MSVEVPLAVAVVALLLGQEIFICLPIFVLWTRRSLDSLESSSVLVVRELFPDLHSSYSVGKDHERLAFLVFDNGVEVWISRLMLRAQLIAVRAERILCVGAVSMV